jgi:hypothetical protein
MPSWLTFLLPVTTYIGGVLSRPLQAVIEDWRAQGKLRNSLYADMGHNADVAAKRIRIILRVPDKYDDIIHAPFVKDSFAHALADPSLFHQLRESRQIRRFYSILNSIDNVKDEKELLGALGLLIRNVADGLKNGDYQRKLVYQHVSKITKHMIDQRECGLAE